MLDYGEISDELTAMLKEIDKLKKRVIKLSIAVTTEQASKIMEDMQKR